MPRCSKRQRHVASCRWNLFGPSDAEQSEEPQALAAPASPRLLEAESSRFDEEGTASYYGDDAYYYGDEIYMEQTERMKPTPQPSPPPTENGRMPYKLIAGLAFAGAAITGYLTLEKLRGGSVVCPASGGCETVLSSGFASIFGVPLSLLGFLAYGSVAGTALWQASKEQQKESDIARVAVLVGGTALAATSSNLLYLLATKFPGQTCTWCLTSALLSFSVFAAACTGFRLRELANLAAPGGLTAGGVVLLLSLAWNGVEAPFALADLSIPYEATLIRERSSPKAIEMAKRLSEAGAKMYGAFWCSHCEEQKVSFGREAQADLPYIECFPEGFKPGVQMTAECKAVTPEGFPLWIINGHRYEGAQSLADLDKALKRPPPT